MRTLRTFMLAVALTVAPTAALVVTSASPAAADEGYVWECYGVDNYSHSTETDIAPGAWYVIDWYDHFWECFDGYNYTSGYMYSWGQGYTVTEN